MQKGIGAGIPRRSHAHRNRNGDARRSGRNKVFPCNAVGGPDYIRSLIAPFPDAILFPCGGVSAKNAAAYFTAGARALFTGTQLVDRETMNSGRYNDITQKALNLSAIAAASRKKAA